MTMATQAQALSQAFYDLGDEKISQYLWDERDQKVIKTFATFAYKKAKKTENFNVLALLRWAGLS